MEESKKKRIVIASILKPVDDTRMYEKMARCLNSARYEIHVIGYPTRTSEVLTTVITHPSRTFKRLSIQRFLQPFRALKIIWKLKPALLIINTHELLCVGFILKYLSKCKLVYDIQENYFRNILFTNTFSIWLRPILALYVRTKEIVLIPFIDHFILAEKVYEKELTFLPARKTILENKLKKSAYTFNKRSQDDGLIHLLFSGTLAKTTGVFEAIDLALQLHEFDTNIRLTIIGYCAQHQVFKDIQAKISGHYFITLIGGNYLVPHEQVLKEIQESDFGIISYPNNQSTQHSFPTKLFEYLGYKLPILLTDYTPWVDYCAAYPAAIIINEIHQPNSILHQMKNTRFYLSDPKEVYWDGNHFSEVIEQLCEF